MFQISSFSLQWSKLLVRCLQVASCHAFGQFSNCVVVFRQLCCENSQYTLRCIVDICCTCM